MKLLFPGRLTFFITFLSVVISNTYAQNSQEFDIYPLWTGGEIPSKTDIPELKNVKFRMIKNFEPEVDSFRFLHGLAIEHYRGKWVVTFGHNKGPENTGSEEANSMWSKNGKKWKSLIPIANPPGDLAVSHGVLLNHDNTLWSFNGSFRGIMKEMKTSAYIWNDESHSWEMRSVNVAQGFWPLQQPLKMENGHWIMAGAYFGEKGTVPAVAICQDNDFLQWKVNVVPTTVSVWGECSVIPDGPNILLISRSSTATPRFDGHSHPLAWVSVSKDFGQTWSRLQPSNMPMAASKPYSGILSNGQRYLIASTTADSKNARHPLTIAVSEPGVNTFSKLFCIRRAILDKEQVESDPNAALAYPYAVEHQGKLWVVYSNSGGRSGQERASWNNNSAELAIIPIKELK